MTVHRNIESPFSRRLAECTVEGCTQEGSQKGGLCKQHQGRHHEVGSANDGRHLTEEEIQTIYKMNGALKTQGEIAKAVGCSRSQVGRILRARKKAR
jgi:DNA invertase Pin-like site-specific DNA recombinase